jgi:hypothetical protein
VQPDDLKLWEANLSILSETHPQAATLLATAKALPDTEVKDLSLQLGRKGHLTLLTHDKLGEFYLHSLYDPISEAKQTATKELDDPKINVVVVFGFGLGYLLEEILKACDKKTRIVIVESRLDCLVTALSSRALDNVLSDERLKFILETNSKKAATKTNLELSFDKLKSWKIIATPQQTRFNQTYLKSYIDHLGACINQRVSSFSTSMNLSAYFLKNSVANIDAAAQSPGVKQFTDCWKNRPAVIVAAGPSLNKQLATLHAYQDKLLIVAVDKTWPILKAAGIKPHIVVAIDPRRPCSWGDDPPQDVWFLSVGSCNPDVVHSINTQRIVSYGNPVHEKIFKHIIGERGVLHTGGSVATNAFSFARLMGASPLIMIGQDLAYTGGASHASGYLWPKTLDEAKGTKGDGFREIEGYHGDRVQVDRQLDSYRKWYEDFIAAHPNDTVINATEGGAKIAGTRQLPFSEACSLYAEDTRVTAEPIAQAAQGFTPIDYSIVQEKFVELIAQIESIQSIAEEAEQIFEKLSLNKRGKKYEQRLQNRLSDLKLMIRAMENQGKLFLQEIVRKDSFTAVRKIKIAEDSDAERENVVRDYFEALAYGCKRAIDLIHEHMYPNPEYANNEASLVK